MMGNVRLLKPEFADLRQDPAFVGDKRRQDMIKRADSITRDHQIMIAKIENVTDFSLSNKRCHRNLFAKVGLGWKEATIAHFRRFRTLFEQYKTLVENVVKWQPGFTL